MSLKQITLQSPLSRDALLRLLRSDGPLAQPTKVRTDQTTFGFRSATLKVQKDGTFRIVLDGVQANGVTGANVEGRGRVADGINGGSHILLTLEASVVTKLKVVLVCAFCFGTDASLHSTAWLRPDALATAAGGALLFLFFLWLEVSRIASNVWPGVTALGERLAAGNLHVPLPTANNAAST